MQSQDQRNPFPWHRPVRPWVRSRMALSALLVILLPAAAAGGESTHAGEAVDDEIQRIVILDLQVVDVEPTLARHLSSQLALSAREALQGSEVLDQDDIRRLLELEAERMMLGCEDQAQCMAEIGGALGADHLATGSVGRIGKIYTVELKLFDTVRARTIRHLGERGVESPERLLDIVAILTAHLLDPDQPANAGFVDIGGSGRVTVDGELLGEAPIRRVRLPAGTRRITWLDHGGASLAVGVDTYSSQRVEPPAGPGSVQSPPALGDAPADGGPAAPVRGDLGRFYARFGLGSVTLAGVGEGVGIAFQTGFTLGSRTDLFFLQNVQSAPSGPGARQWGLGAGVLLGKSLRIRPNVWLGFGGANPGGRGLAAGGGFDLAYAMNRYLEMGLDLSVGAVPAAKLGYAQSLFYIGLPSITRLPYPASNWRSDGWFWATGTVVAIGTVLTFLAAAGT